ncbi:MAG: glycosyl hydrolase 115 family protein [Prevotella sp.]|nr:glycosyl hydrolase 115 family protein [Prevotella sp.]
MKQLLALFLCLLTCVSATAADLTWFDGQHPITYCLTSQPSPVLQSALAMWKADMQQVTGLTPVHDPHATIQLIEGKGEEDGFSIYCKNGRIVVEGFSPRGTAFGLLELSRMAGVSPWIWWGDIVPERKARLTIDTSYETEQHASVQYRGIFLNDEDWSLRPWSYQTNDPGPKGRIGVQTYKRIFQLLLRLRANTIWPAMHEGTTAFFNLPGAKAMADSFGIVIGTSHCEPLLRNNVGEWDIAQRGRFNYRTNRQAVQSYWAERLQEVSHSKNNLFTIGMRGIHDSSMEGYKTEQEKFDALQQVIDDQQQLLSQYIGNPSQVTQVFVPYKEVLQLYERGLHVPDYVTLMWCDDNYGYMTRYSSPAEQLRSGGSGIYYHLSYWGRPHDYLWLCTTQPGLIYNELREAYNRQARKLWIANVHDPKVAGYQLELFLDMAWDINSVSATTLGQHYSRWLCRQFGTEAGQRLFLAMHTFYRLCGERRPEFMGWTQVELDKSKYHRGLSTVGTLALTTDEAVLRLDSFEHIKTIVAEAKTLVRPELSNAYYAAIVYPVTATAAMNRKMLCDSTASHQAYLEIQELTRQYNELAHGKWKGIMDAAPRRLPVFDDCRGSLANDSLKRVLVTKRDMCEFERHTGNIQAVEMLGRSMRAVALPKDATLTFSFHVDSSAEYMLTTVLIPTHPVDDGLLRYSVSIDRQEPVIFNLKEPFRSEQWKLNVLSGQVANDQTIHLSKGKHTLTIKALDDHIVCDQWMLTKAP